ncbi:hypothetical protein, partial [Streptomyces sp. NPDC018347]|uniref:hypothetical protein n=1 Tax=Streptomyces sp. NPDC018347 TaxID=3157193 RepID=UPI0033FA4EBE
GTPPRASTARTRRSCAASSGSSYTAGAGAAVRRVRDGRVRDGDRRRRPPPETAGRVMADTGPAGPRAPVDP